MTKYFAFLDELQDSGLVNMNEARRMLKDLFRLTTEVSHEIFDEWKKRKSEN